MNNNNKGFTLIELIIVSLILIIVIIISARAFEIIISKSAQLTRSAQSNIQGIVGLELMRADLESAGFGLPWTFAGSVKYTECLASGNVAGIDPKGDFNDGKGSSTDGDVPRAVLSKTSAAGTDYLVVKSAAVGDDQASRRWSFVNYSSPSAGVIRSYKVNSGLFDGDRAVTLKMSFSADAGSGGSRQLLVSPSGPYYYAVNGSLSPADFSPGDASEFYVAYGISTGVTPTMPFNRADYYVYRPAVMPQRCAKGTGNLYKAAVRHKDGMFNEVPILDCVLDMQVSYVLDPNNDGKLVYTKSLMIPAMSSLDIRNQLRSINVTILTHEGGFDRNYAYPANSISVAPNGLPSLGRTWTSTEFAGADAVLGKTWKNYRWKVYEIAVQPKNLNQ